MALLRKHIFESPEELFEDLHLAVSSQGDFATDIYQDKNSVIVKMHAPGIDKDTIDITVDEDRLTIAASRETKEEMKGKNFFRREIRYGSFMRTLSLPCAVEKDQAVAEYDDGVLTITLPKKKSAEPSKIKVTSKSASTNQTTVTPPRGA